MSHHQGRLSLHGLFFSHVLFLFFKLRLGYFLSYLLHAILSSFEIFKSLLIPVTDSPGIGHQLEDRLRSFPDLDVLFDSGHGGLLRDLELVHVIGR